MILYLAGSIPLGVLGDRMARNRLIAVGVGVWGAATVLSGLARSYGQLFTARALVGIGEASYGPTASAMVSDLFPRERRGFVNALFNAAIPLGGAIGVMAGGLVGSRYGWRAAFLLVGLPSIALTILAWRLGDPPRGAQDHLAADRARPASRRVLRGRAWGCSARRPSSWSARSACSWRSRSAPSTTGSRSTSTGSSSSPCPRPASGSGSSRRPADSSASSAGGFVGDLLARRTPAGHLLTIAGGFLLAAPAGIVMILAQDRAVFLPALFFAVTFLVLYIGSVNAVIHNVVHPALRATAVAIFVFIINLGGAALSPAIVGLVSDRRQSLQAAMLMLPVLVFFAGLIALAAATVIGSDMRRLGARPAGAAWLSPSGSGRCSAACRG